MNLFLFFYNCVVKNWQTNQKNNKFNANKSPKNNQNKTNMDMSYDMFISYLKFNNVRNII